MKNTTPPDARYQLATLALKARRYVEAEQRFAEMLALSPSPELWIGLGQAKIGTFMHGTTTSDEIVYCFNQAKSGESQADIALAHTAFLGTVKEFLDLAGATLLELRAHGIAAAGSRRLGIFKIGVGILTDSSRHVGGAISAATLRNQGTNRVAEARAIRQNVEASNRALYTRLVAMRSAIPQVLPAEHPGLSSAIVAVDNVIFTLYPHAKAREMQAGGVSSAVGTGSVGLPQAPTTGTSGMAIASVVCGVLGVAIMPLAIPAIILGHVASSRIRRAGGKLGGKRLASMGLAAGYAVLAFLLGLGIFVALNKR